MRNDEVLVGTLIEESWLTLEEVAAAGGVEIQWLRGHLEAGLLGPVACLGGTWRVSGAALLRARRMRELERDFEAAPELAALVADLLDEMDALRARLGETATRRTRG